MAKTSSPYEHLSDLLDRMNSLAAQSDVDLAIARERYTLTTDCRWLLTADAAFEEVSIDEMVDDLGVERLVAEL